MQNKNSAKIHDINPENILKHCYGVALKMYYYALRLGHSELYAQDMFLLGMIHDIGYFYDPSPFMHDQKMFEVMNRSSQGRYRYLNALRFHSKYQDKYDTEEMRLLYYADSTVDGKGNWVTFEEHLKDIETRHGKDSEVYKASAEIIEKCKEWGFDNSANL